MNAILDEGILATCDDLCGFVANKTGSKILGDMCDVVCDAFGIDEFIKALINFDIDPIYYCQILKLCPIKDDGDAKFTNFGVSPKTGDRTTKFLLDCSFSTKNGTGTGSYLITIINPKAQAMSAEYWFEEKPPGSYTELIPLDAIQMNCDPKLGENHYYNTQKISFFLTSH
ncbi:unnamed protein product [Rotaria sp. Silwood2]|nr:unnamed protein product [Rotaria sp. Silwood2]CAF4340366.1 unnamed protein product [Rotaria sp. Silwood2]